MNNFQTALDRIWEEDIKVFDADYAYSKYINYEFEDSEYLRINFPDRDFFASMDGKSSLF